MRERGQIGQRGSIAVELGLAIPILFFVLLGGLQFGRALITRHRLENAVAYLEDRGDRDVRRCGSARLVHSYRL